MSERKILVVDDEASIREMLEMALSKAGYLVRLATGAEEALGILRKEYIPVMFIDVGLEKMNGFELCVNVCFQKVLDNSEIKIREGSGPKYLLSVR